MIVASPKGLESFFISKTDGKVECTCGDKGCAHQQAVKAYVAAGGESAKPSDPKEVRQKLGLTRCPVCGDQLMKDWGNTWRCAEGGNVHYFEWLNSHHNDVIRLWITGEGKKAWDTLLEGGNGELEAGRRDTEPTPGQEGVQGTPSRA